MSASNTTVFCPVLCPKRAINGSLLFTHSGGTCSTRQSRPLPSPATPFFAVIFLPSTIQSHAHHHGIASACSPHCWHCRALAECAQRAAAAQSITGKLIGRRGFDHQLHGTAPISSSNAALMAQHPSLCMCMEPSSDARSPVPWAPSPAPLQHGAPQRVSAHRGTNHASVSRSKDAARDMLVIAGADDHACRRSSSRIKLPNNR